jgi:hypothetical protein
MNQEWFLSYKVSSELRWQLGGGGGTGTKPQL